MQAYDLGIYTFFSSVVLSCVLLAQDIKLAEKLLRDSKLFFALRAVELGTAIALAVSGVAIPRRPDVYVDGELVDKMYTVSALSRFTWSWPHTVLGLARKKNDLDMVDLARPDHLTRAAAMSDSWKRKNHEHRLWVSVVLAHKKEFALQWILTLVTSLLNFGPQWVILQLLRILETRRAGESVGPEVWIWTVWLGLVIIAQSWAESYVFWLSWVQLAIPVRAQLSALIFEKAMRKKDVKGTGKSSNKATVEESAEPTVAGPETPLVEEEPDAAEELKKSKQGTVNLIGVDGKRISDFCSYQNLFPGSLFKLVVSLIFLVSLLGWLPLLSGLSAMLAIMPVNVYFSKKYAASQDRLMKVRDEKLEVVSEALQGIRQIKFSALEPEWENKVGGVREKELKCIWDVFMNDTLLIGCWVTSPILLSAISLAVYATLNDTLTPSVAFVSLGVFKALEMTLSVAPELTTDLLDAWVSVKRIEEYLNSPEIATVTKHAPEVTFDRATIAWPADDEIDDGERFVLRDITATFPQGELSVISGKTGTGKSLMLAAILGEVDVLGGTIYVPEAPSLADRHDSKANKSNWIIPGSIAYVAQIPWIENASIKDNILFGLPYDEERYRKTVEVCALKKDLEMLTDGESTEIGANGINLSGGQKWRVTLARAVYSRAGVLVLDDIFSAVDAHVGRHIFEMCLNGELARGRTRILVTHHVALCQPKTKYLVELGDGGVRHCGLLSELQEDGMLELIKSQVESQQETEADEAPTAVNSDGSTDGEQEDGGADGADGAALKKVASKTAARKFVEDETREQGSVRKHIYYTYFKDSGGWGYWIAALLIFATEKSITVGRSWWLKIWTGNEMAEQSHSMHLYNHSRDHAFSWAVGIEQTSIHTWAAPSTQAQHSLHFYLGIYVLLAVLSSLVGTLKFTYVYFGSIKASRRLFEKLNFVILRAPLRWLDTVPVGRVLNRFTADFHIVDSQLANNVSFGASSFLGLIGVIVAGLFVSPWIVLLAGVLLVICLYYALVYLSGARPVKRLESTAKSPVFEQFGSALTGVSTIRGFDKAQVYLERMYRKLDDYSAASWHLWLFNRWMGWRMSLVGSFFASFVAIFILMTPGIDAALAGFALAFALEFSSSVMWTIRLYANLELNMNAAERIIEYTELPTESLEGTSPPAAWPTRGIIEVDDLVVSYAPDLPPVLKGLSFSVNSNERVGVVGRTGAGKSSLTLALFRFLEARSGTIHIDGIDISKVKLHDLRSRLAIIPQVSPTCPRRQTDSPPTSLLTSGNRTPCCSPARSAPTSTPSTTTPTPPSATVSSASTSYPRRPPPPRAPPRPPPLRPRAPRTPTSSATSPPRSRREG